MLEACVEALAYVDAATFAPMMSCARHMLGKVAGAVCADVLALHGVACVTVVCSAVFEVYIERRKESVYYQRYKSVSIGH